MDIARITISVLLALMLVATGGGKLAGLSSSRAIRDGLRLSPAFWRVIGVLEILAVVGLVGGIWFPWAGVAASVGVVALMIGAVGFRLRAGGKQRNGITGDVVILVVAAVCAALSALAH
jgi:uncharacterized membrane protein YphA (DoxX/SURF4 family)